MVTRSIEVWKVGPIVKLQKKKETLVNVLTGLSVYCKQGALQDNAKYDAEGCGWSVGERAGWI